MTDVELKKLIYELVPLVGDHEGKRNKRYKDTEGFWTIGIGHNIDANKLPPDIAEFERQNGYITDEMVNRLFSTDIMTAITDCQKVYSNFDSYPWRCKVALVDIMFNFGITKWTAQFGNTIKHIINGEWEDVEQHLANSKWYRQVGRRAKDDIALIDTRDEEV